MCQYYDTLGLEPITVAVDQPFLGEPAKECPAKDEEQEGREDPTDPKPADNTSC